MAGDVFQFASSDGGWGYGQVLYSEIIQYIVIFENRSINKLSAEEATSSRPLLSGWTMDGRVYSGDWEVVGNVAPVSGVTLPLYKVGVSGRTWITDFRGERLRLASPDEERRLTFQKSFSPIAFEKAFNAYHGDQPWEARFDELLVR